MLILAHTVASYAEERARLDDPYPYGIFPSDVPKDFYFTQKLPEGIPDVRPWEKTWGNFDLCVNANFARVRALPRTSLFMILVGGTEICSDDVDPKTSKMYLMTIQYMFYLDLAVQPKRYTILRYRFLPPMVFQEGLYWRKYSKPEDDVVFKRVGEHWVQSPAGGEDQLLASQFAQWLINVHGKLLHERDAGKLQK